MALSNTASQKLFHRKRQRSAYNRPDTTRKKRTPEANWRQKYNNNFAPERTRAERLTACEHDEKVREQKP